PMTSQKVLPRPDRETGRVPHVSHLRRGGSNFPKKRSTLRRNFKDHAATNAPALQPAALHGRSVNIPGRIQEEIGEWHASVPAARERVQHRLVALRIELIDGSAVEVPAKRSRAVQIAGRVAHQVIPRAAAVIVASKAVQDGFIAGGVQLVDHAATITAGRAVQASPGRDAVDVARGVARDSSILRRLAVSAADLAK